MIRGVAATLACGICVAALATPAQAQTRNYRIPAGSLKSALDNYARQSGRQLIYKVDEIRRVRSPGVRGAVSAEAALAAILAGTGFRAQGDSSGALAIVRTNAAASLMSTSPTSSNPASSTAAQMAEDDPEAVPEILVVGRREWSLNTGIERTRDDAQPFVVFDQEQIRRTGATSLEQFLSQQLTSNSTPGTTELGSTTGEGRSLGRSEVSLRGLGARETLILVDGRRRPGLNTGEGNLEQPVIGNIPLASIDRIEVLSSSAAGIYGVGATGGVVNIVLRRDYTGGEISLNYANTTDFKAPDLRIDLNYGTSIEGGRTNLSFTGSYRKSDPLTYKERQDYINDARRRSLAINPLYVNIPPLGTTANIKSAPALVFLPNGSFSIGFPNLTFDPIYGGGPLGSDRTFAPPGYRGAAVDGVAGLLANAGQFNFALPSTSGSGGAPAARTPLVIGSDLASASIAARREMNSWLRMYAEIAGSRSKAVYATNLVSQQISLDGNNPRNPFQQRIVVTLPIYDYEDELTSKTDELRLVGGAIATLGGGWQAAIDASYSQSWYQPSQSATGSATRTVPFSSAARLANGTYDPLRDSTLDPFVFEIVESTLPSPNYKSAVLDVQLKVAGPLPIGLPGGKPTVSLNLERSRQNLSDIFSIENTPTFASITYTPPRSETIYSAYGEVRVPLIGDSNDIPLIRQLEITAAGRFEHYIGQGSGVLYPCFSSNTGFPGGVVDIGACDPATLDFPRVKFTNDHFDPSVALRWQVIPDLTFRASYATGYLPPRLAQLISVPTTGLIVQARDPERGGEVVGTRSPFLPPDAGLVAGSRGGNPDLANEKSESLTAGAILTPRFMPGFRFSVDYTRIEKTDNFASPENLLVRSFNTEGEEAFATFLRLFPERITRGPPSGGFAVGPITSINATLINIALTKIEALDFALDYGFDLFAGKLDVSASATYNLTAASQDFPDSDIVDYSGVVPYPGTVQAFFSNGSVKWRGVGSVRWSNDRASIGWRGRYIDGYFFNLQRTVEPNEGRARLPSQFYMDLFGSYRFEGGVMLRAGVNNFLNRRAPYVLGGYSGYGDPRGANFYINLSKEF